MQARIVLDDCRLALELAENSTTEEEFRVHWVALVALLRAVGHVLKKVDAGVDPSIKMRSNELWVRWQQNRDENKIFWDFIEAERNSVLKEYELGPQAGNIEVAIIHLDHAQPFTLDECIFKPLTNGPFAGEDGRDIAKDAIQWWEQQLKFIENSE